MTEPMGRPRPRSTAARMVRQIQLPSGDSIPALGQGSAGLAEGRRPAAEEIAALRLGLDLGLTLIDTAETYAGGEAETLVGRAVTGRRDEVFLLSKVAAARATRRGTVAACEQSLARLGTDHLDLYLLQSRPEHPLTDTVAAFEELRERELIRHWGVGNFSLTDLADLAKLEAGGEVQALQLRYSLARRGVEWDVVPACQAVGLPVLASSPLDGGWFVDDGVLRGIAVRHRVTPAQVALAWVLSHAGVHAHPRATTHAHVERNRAALDVELGADDLTELDVAFEPPPAPVA
jgi:diketogulonate reductase-like aldo/keto reductase